MKHAWTRLISLCLALLLAAPQALAYSKLQKGAKGVEVLAMQDALKKLGFSITADGKYGDATVKAVKAFQKQYGLTVDGVAGNKTLTLLYSLADMTAPRAVTTPTPDVPTAVVTTGGGSLKLRAKASTASSVVVYAYIPEGERIEIKKKGTTWCTAVYKGKTGYVMTQYLRFDTTPAATPKKTNKPTATPKVSGTAATVSTKNGGSLNMRSAMTTSGNNIVAVIPNGAKIVVTARGSVWCAVTYGGYSGYVMTQHLKFSAATAKPTATPKATKTPKPTATPKADAANIAYVTTSNGKSLNLRSAANSTRDNVVATIPNGTRLVIASKGKTWCKTSYNGKTGYVMTAFLSFPVSETATPKPTATPKKSGAAVKGYVNTSNGSALNLRKSASDSVAVLATIPNGAEVTVTNRGTTWCAVTYNGVSGYVMTKFLYIPAAATATPKAAKATATPKPQSGVFTRVLRSGDTGSDVRWVQTRLAELGYSVNINSAYDSATVNAVKAFQRQNGLTADGLAGEQTFAVLGSDAARRAADSAVSYSTLRIDNTGSEVTAMQNALKKLGYPVTVNGTYDTDTHNAVVAFQVRNHLVISGIADGLTRTAILSGSGKPYSTKVTELPANTGRMATPKKIQLLHWQNDIKPTVKAGETILVFDPQTNLSWNLVFYSLGRHADSQPATWQDTQIMNRSFGSTSWAIHPVYVKLPSGVWTIATMHNRPHLYGSITANGFGGHLCVHFLRTMTEAQQNDPEYGVQNQITLRNAWKALTGETIRD